MTVQASTAVPGKKRVMRYQQALAKAREGVRNKTIKPTIQSIRDYCNVGGKAAESIRATLVDEGLCSVTGTGRLEIAA